MATRNKWKDLRSKMTTERQSKIQAKTQKLNTEYRMALQVLRKSLGITQEDLAELMNVSQHVVSKMENGQNMYITTLQRIIEAMGGELKLLARFPDREVVIDQFEVE